MQSIQIHPARSKDAAIPLGPREEDLQWSVFYHTSVTSDTADRLAPSPVHPDMFLMRTLDGVLRVVNVRRKHRGPRRLSGSATFLLRALISCRSVWRLEGCGNLLRGKFSVLAWLWPAAIGTSTCTTGLPLGSGSPWCGKTHPLC
jgi:hypothetical protein